MKKLYILLITTALLSCGTSKEEETSILLETEEEEFVPVSAETDELLNKIFGQGNAAFRGFNLGDNISDVYQKESLTLFEENEGKLAYTYETANFQMVDIYYLYNREQKLDSIKVDLFLIDDSTAAKTQNALSTYFTLKYGKSIDEFTHGAQWNMKSGQNVKIENVSKGLDHGLVITYFVY